MEFFKRDGTSNIFFISFPLRHRGWIETGFIFISPLAQSHGGNPLLEGKSFRISDTWWAVLRSPFSRPWSNKINCHSSHSISFNNEYFGTVLMGLRIVSIAHMLNSTAGPQQRTVRSQSNHFCGTCPAPSQPSSSCIFDLFGEHVDLPGHAVFFSEQTRSLFCQWMSSSS